MQNYLINGAVVNEICNEFAILIPTTNLLTLQDVYNNTHSLLNHPHCYV